MNITILGQGFEAESKSSVGRQLIRLFADKRYHSFTGISAFASKPGINGIAKHITAAKNHLTKITIVTGVDQKGTSKETLEAILAMKVNGYVFYEPSIVIFHPKIYLFEGDTHSELIIGSSNLTSHGLFRNIETSLLICIDNSVAAEIAIVEQLKTYFQGIFDFTDPNLKKLSKKVIGELVIAKLVPTEAERKETHDKADKTVGASTIKFISAMFPKRAIAKMPGEFRGIGIKRSKLAIATNVAPIGTESPRGKLVWIQEKLPASSVQRSPVGKPTGGLRLVQGDFKIKGKKIVQTKYFRNSLFGDFEWENIKKKPYVECTTISFEVTIRNEFIGKFDLEVRHKPSGEAGQGNYTTSISWGELGETIKQANLTGSQLELFAPKGRGKVFHIVIS